MPAYESGSGHPIDVVEPGEKEYGPAPVNIFWNVSDAVMEKASPHTARTRKIGHAQKSPVVSVLTCADTTGKSTQRIGRIFRISCMGTKYPTR